jgi:hypothetical protein
VRFSNFTSTIIQLCVSQRDIQSFYFFSPLTLNSHSSPLIISLLYLMNTANRFNLASNHLQISEMINPEEKDEQRHESAFHKFPSEFYECSDHSRWWLISLTATILSCLQRSVHWYKLGRLPGQRQADNQRDTPNYVDGSFHTTCTRGFGGYGSEMYIWLYPATILIQESACPYREKI